MIILLLLLLLLHVLYYIVKPTYSNSTEKNDFGYGLLNMCAVLFPCFLSIFVTPLNSVCETQLSRLKLELLAFL